jgi:hypothetical protein
MMYASAAASPIALREFTGLEYRDHRGDEFGRAVEADAHLLARLHPELAQARGETLHHVGL